jgi:predicted dehydrogenase
MSKVWKVGLVGAGRGSSYGNLTYRDPRFDIVALCDSNEDALARYQKELGFPDSQCFTDYEEFVNSSPVDAIIICTPILHHADQAVIALDLGINVMSEVTASNTIEGCARIVEAARRSDGIYMLAENTIFRPIFDDWGKTIKSGKLGEVFYAEADYLHPIPSLLVNQKTGERHWRADRPPVHYCSHSIGPILYLTGHRIVRAMAVGNSYRILPDVGVGAIDIQLAVFETEKNMIIKMTRTQVAPRHPPIHYYHILGTDGFLETNRLGPDRKERKQHGLMYIKSEMEHVEEVAWPEIDTSLPDFAVLGGHGTSDYNTLRQFLNALDAGKKPVLDEIRAWDLTVPGLVAAESAMQNGKWMDVPLPD